MIYKLDYNQFLIISISFYLKFVFKLFINLVIIEKISKINIILFGKIIN